MIVLSTCNNFILVFQHLSKAQLYSINKLYDFFLEKIH